MLERVQFDVKVLFGCFCVFSSAFFFYLATVIVKWARIDGLTIDPAFFVFSRFLLGFFTVSILMMLKKKKLRIVSKHYLFGRTIANCIAVYCFFKGVDLTSVAQANILNMTYPLFITLFSWFFLREQRDAIAVIIVILAFSGVFLILAPEDKNFHLNSLWALASGVSAAIAGQYMITVGFKYVTAVEGGILSSTRILLAAVLGPFIAMDPALTSSGWIGAFLIFAGNVYLTLRNAKRGRKTIRSVV